MGRSDRVIKFVSQLTHTSGLFAGQSFQLRYWQKDIIRDMYDEAATTHNNPWGTSISNHKRQHERGIQGVRCWDGISSFDHTFETPIKNYQRQLGAKALWDAGTHTLAK